MTVHNLLFCAHTLCMNYVTNTFLLACSSVRSKQLLCFVHGQDQKREQKPTTKKFVGFHNHSPLLTMITGYEKSVKADQHQEEEEFSFLNIHAWKMSHCKEISDDHAIVIKLRKK